MDGKQQYTENEKRLILEKAALNSRIAILMQGLAAIAKRNPTEQDFIRRIVTASNESGKNIRWEDLTHGVKVN